MTRSLVYAGRTVQGHYRLLAPSKSRPGAWNAVLLSGDRSRVSCACTAAARHPLRRDGRLTVSAADVIAGKVRVCWHLDAAAEWAPPVEIRREGDALEASAPPTPSVGTLRRVARVVRRAGGKAEVRRLRVGWSEDPERWGWVLCYEIDNHGGEWDGKEHDLWAGVCFLVAAESLGWSTRVTAVVAGRARLYEAEAWRRGDRLAIKATGPSRTMAAAALVVAVERLTRGKRGRR